MICGVSLMIKHSEFRLRIGVSIAISIGVKALASVSSLQNYNF
jgi:hypothetical protein